MTEAFTYRNGRLEADGVPLDAVADAVGTPVYCYASSAIEGAYREFERAFGGLDATICYAVKANGNLAVLRTLARLGAGMDVVSEGELRRALAAGVPPERIVFSGVGKTRSEMRFALEAGIMQINVESVEELVILDQEARKLGVRAPVSLRVNPDVDAGTHHRITTGRKTDKFGIDYDQAPAAYRQAAALSGIDPVGVAVHIGSQLVRLEPYRAAFRRVADLVRGLRADGIAIRRLDLGGGLGIVYRDETPPSIAEYAAVVREATAGLDCTLVVEPGRRIVGPAGVLLARVVTVKETPGRRFVIVDAGMNDLVRPMMYEAYHPIWPVCEPVAAATAPADVVGPICETTDIFAAQRALPPLTEGDVVAFGAAGAYGAAMASEYNGRPLVPEVLLHDGHWAVVRIRPSYDTMLSFDRLPEWLEAGAPDEGGGNDGG